MAAVIQTINRSAVRKFASLDSDDSGELGYRETLGIREV